MYEQSTTRRRTESRGLASEGEFPIAAAPRSENRGLARGGRIWTKPAEDQGFGKGGSAGRGGEASIGDRDGLGRDLDRPSHLGRACLCSSLERCGSRIDLPFSAHRSRPSSDWTFQSDPFLLPFKGRWIRWGKAQLESIVRPSSAFDDGDGVQSDAVSRRSKHPTRQRGAVQSHPRGRQRKWRRKPASVRRWDGGKGRETPPRRGKEA